MESSHQTTSRLATHFEGPTELTSDNVSSTVQLSSSSVFYVPTPCPIASTSPEKPSRTIIHLSTKAFIEPHKGLFGMPSGNTSHGHNFSISSTGDANSSSPGPFEQNCSLFAVTTDRSQKRRRVPTGASIEYDDEVPTKRRKTIHDASPRNSVVAKRTLWKFPNSEGVDTLFYNGEEYPVEELGKGQYHKVFGFIDPTGDRTITIHLKNNETVTQPVKDVVLRIISGAAQPKRNRLAERRGISSLELDDIEADRVLRERNVPLPQTYATPETILDPKNAKNGAFALVERLHSIESSVLEELQQPQETRSLSKDAQQLQNWVIDMFNEDINYLANHAERRVFDFKPDNVMYRWIEVQQPDGSTLKEKEYVLADAQLSPSRDSLWDAANDLATDIYKWSASNESFAKRLLDMVPESIEFSPQVEGQSRKGKPNAFKQDVVEHYATTQKRHR